MSVTVYQFDLFNIYLFVYSFTYKIYLILFKPCESGFQKLNNTAQY